MPATATINTTLEFPPTPEGVAAARLKLEALGATFGSGEPDTETSSSQPAAPRPAPGGSSGDAARLVYRGAGETSRTRQMLKALPGEDGHPLTFDEISPSLTPKDDGSLLNRAEVRAVHRNEKRIERTLQKRGEIPEDRVVIRQEWDYEEGLGRYYLSNADRDVIRDL